MKYADGPRYEKVYIPVVLRINKYRVEHYTYLDTIKAGNSTAHILFGGGIYYMCISRDDNVSVEEKTMEPIGFRNEKLEQLKLLADKFNGARRSDYGDIIDTHRRKWKKVVHPMRCDGNLTWWQRMQNQYIINTINGQEIPLAQRRKDLSAKINISESLISAMFRQGVEIKHWCYKGKRLDGLSWEEYFSGKRNDEFFHTNLLFKKGDEEIYYETLRETGKNIGVSHQTLRMALINNLDTINGYSIIRSSSSLDNHS